MTPPARLQPVQAWAIVDRVGAFARQGARCLIFWEKAEAQASLARCNWDDQRRHRVVRVTVRAWAPPKQKKVKR